MKKVFTTLLAVIVMSTFAFAQQYNTMARRIPAQIAQQVSQVKAIKHLTTKTATSSMSRAITKDGATTITTFPYEMGFENGLESWTTIDNDNDGMNWVLGYAQEEGARVPAHTGDYCICSYSFDNNSGSPLMPDNWLISPAIALDDSYELSWYVAAQDPSYVAEKYSVYVATTNTVEGFTATTPVFTEVIASGDWGKRMVDLSSYAGQTVYIAFRHYESTDNFMMKIDDIKVGEFSAPEVVLTAPKYAKMNDSVYFVATVSGMNTTTSWEVDGVADGTTENRLGLVFDIPGEHIVIVTVDNANGSATDTAKVNIIDCSTITEFPYEDGFEDGYLCWTQIDKNDDGLDFISLADAESMLGLIETSNSGEEAMLSLSGFPLFGMLFPMPQENYLVSRQISVSGDCSLFAMFAKSMGDIEDTFAVYVTTEIPDTNTVFTAEQTIIPMQGANIGEYALYTADMTPYDGQDVYIVIHHKSAGAGALLIDDVYLGGNAVPKPVIEAPKDVREGREASFSARTISPATGVTYSWTFDGAEDPTTVDGETATAIWATAGVYDVTVSASNDEGSNDTTIQMTVYGCPAITELPDTTLFEEMVDFHCWDVIDANNDNSTWYLLEGFGAVNNSLNFETEAPITPDDYLVSPTYTIPEEGHYEVTFVVQPGDAQAFAENYSVYVSTEGTEVENFTTPIFTETITEPRIYQHSISLDAYAGQNVNIAFRHHDCSGQVALVIRSVVVREMPVPENAVILGPTSAIVDQEVVYTASAEGTVESYSWTIDGSAVNSTTNTLTTSFAEGGEHIIAVTATNAMGSANASITVNVIECSDITEFPYVENFNNGMLGCWTSIDRDQDGHSWEYGFPQDGIPLGYNETDCAVSYSFDNPSLSALNPDNWLVSPAIVVPAESEYNVSWMASPAANPEYMVEHYSVYVATENTTDAFLATQAKYSETTSDPEWHEHAISLANYAGQKVYVAFRHHDCTDNFVLRIDDIKIQEGHVGINDVTVDMSLYPNPTTGMIMINADGVEMIEVLDVNGRVVMTQATAGEINMSNLSNGVYFVRVITDNGTAVKKVIKH